MILDVRVKDLSCHNRKLAVMRAMRYGGMLGIRYQSRKEILNEQLSCCFNWKETPEGHHYWHSIRFGRNKKKTKIPRYVRLSNSKNKAY